MLDPLPRALFVALALPLAALAGATTALEPAQRRELLAEHNRWRQEVGVAALHWSADLAASAQRWADHLRIAVNCFPAHNPDTSWGENLYWASANRWSDGRLTTQPIAPAQVVIAWAGEKSLYDTRSGNCRPGTECGHYTQLVWRGTTELGCGMAVCPDHSQVWVCHYQPAGNVAGRRAY